MTFSALSQSWRYKMVRRKMRNPDNEEVLGGFTADMMRAGRALLGWEQRDLAERTMLSVGGVRRLESLEGPVTAQRRTLHAIEQAFAEAGVTFKRTGRTDGDSFVEQTIVTLTRKTELKDDELAP